jgi:hypothetical protein
MKSDLSLETSNCFTKEKGSSKDMNMILQKEDFYLACFAGAITRTVRPSLSRKFALYILPVSDSTDTSG